MSVGGIWFENFKVLGIMHISFHTCIIVFCVIYSSLFIVDMFYWQRACSEANTKRRIFFGNRPIMAESEWENLYFELDCPQKETIEICSIVSNSLDCHLTQVLPEDSFLKEMKFNTDNKFNGWLCLGRFFSDDDELEKCVERVCSSNEILKRRIENYRMNQKNDKDDLTIRQLIKIVSSS